MCLNNMYYKNNIIIFKNIIKFLLVTTIFFLGTFSSAEGLSYSKLEIRKKIGNDFIKLKNHTLIKCNTPDKYYKNIDYSFLTYESYKSITRKQSKSYKLLNSNRAYTDSLGFRRYKIDEKQFSVISDDDYFIAIGNYYKPKGSSGNRFLLVTDKSMYTVIVGDEKDDRHTDKLNMFSWRPNNRGNMIEFIVDIKKLEKSVRTRGCVTASKNEIINGKIQYIYKILN